MKRTSLTGLFSVMILSLSAGATPSRAADDQAYPAPEPYLSNGQYSTYVTVAEKYLKDNPKSDMAPRVALDVMTIATVMNEPQTVVEMRKKLLLDYSDSFQGKFSLTLYRDAAEFVAMMNFVYQQNVEDPPPGFPAKFSDAMKAGESRFGGEVLRGSPAYLIFVIAMAHESGNSDLEGAAKRILNGGGPVGAIALGVANDLTQTITPPTTLAGVVAKLHDLPDRAGLIQFERFLISKMDATEKAQANVQRIIAEDFVWEGRLDKALEAYQQIHATEQSPRDQFWLAWCTVADGHAEEGAKLLTGLAQNHADNEWGKAAARLLPAALALDADLNAMADDLMLALAQLKDNFGVLEMRCEYQKEDKSTLRVYCGFVADKVFEFSLWRDGKLVAGFRNKPNDSCAYYSEEEKDAQIHEYHSSGLALTPAALQVGPGGMNLTSQATWGTLPRDLTTYLSGLLSQPMFTSRDSIMEILRNQVRRGRVPGVPLATATGVTYTWLYPDPQQPVVNSLDYSIGKDHTLTGLNDGKFKLTEFRTTAAALAFPLNPPPWPADLKTTTKETWDGNNQDDRTVAALVLDCAEKAFLPAAAPSIQATTQPSVLTTQPAAPAH